MHYNFSHKFPLSMIIAVVGSVLYMTACPAFCSPSSASERTLATDHVHFQKPTSEHHPYTLSSVFRKGIVYIKTTVNGHSDAWMVLDTGTTDSLIDSEYARAIGIKLAPKSEGATGFGSMAPATFTTDTVRLRVGAAPASVIIFESIRLEGMIGPDGMPAAGLLGHSFLAGKSIVIDYKREQVYFEKTPQPANQRDVAMTLKNGIPLIKVKIAGQLVNSLIDTGGTYGVIITPSAAKDLGIESLMADAKPAATVGHGGDQHIMIGKAPPFMIGILAVHDLRAAYTTFGTATNTIGAGVSIGIGLLKKYKVTLNYAANTVRFEP